MQAFRLTAVGEDSVLRQLRTPPAPAAAWTSNLMWHMRSATTTHYLPPTLPSPTCPHLHPLPCQPPSPYPYPVPTCRLLAGFEADPHRACVTHRHRSKLLAPLEGQLSPVHFLGLVRSLHLELGNVARTIHEIKEAAGWPAAKVSRRLSVSQGWGLCGHRGPCLAHSGLLRALEGSSAPVCLS
jgi:hypothetical protein